MPSAMPGRSRTRTHGRGLSMLIDDGDDEPAEGDNDDDTIYCSCRKPSYDEVRSLR